MTRIKSSSFTTLMRLLTLLLISVFMHSCEKLFEADETPTLEIGVMLPFTGSYAAEWNNVLDWAVENINTTGGVAGKQLKLIKCDLTNNNHLDIADKFINNSKIKAVIGPLTSGETFDVTPHFIKAKKVLIAPAATASYLSRAYAGKKYFWRMVESDISQMRTLMLIAQSKGAKRVGLITEESSYGASFEDWFGFFAKEMGLEVSTIQVMEKFTTIDYLEAQKKVKSENTDFAIITLGSPEKAASLTKIFRKENDETQLLFSDAASLPSFVSSLGEDANNLEGTNISPNPSSGFDISYKVRYDQYPDAYMANIYDAVLLLAFALESTGGEGGEALANALTTVVDGKMGTCSWQRDDLRKGLDKISKGEYPDIQGASGSLSYDELYYTDVVSSTYGHWRIDEGHFVTTDFFTSDGEGRLSSTSAAYRNVSAERQSFNAQVTNNNLASLNDNYALLIATSQGWINYRHQSDVLQNYQHLKSYGFDDEHIILILADDLAQSNKNPNKGSIFNALNGHNIYASPIIDYKISELNASSLKNIFLGIKTAETPIILEGSPKSNLFIFSSGHGSPEGMVLEGKENEILTPDYWSEIFNTMSSDSTFRQIFWALEACYSGAIGEKITTPNVMLMTGANANETSKSNFFDSEQQVWLSDKFAYAINHTIANTPELTFNALYENCYKYVNGSHVSFYNYQNFGNIHDMKLNEFVVSKSAIE